MEDGGSPAVDPVVIKKTQDTLSRVIKKPPLTEKLLARPPFRFLHDIVTEVVKTTGRFEKLYSTDELDSSKVTDKDAKIAFLQKLIDCLGFLIGGALSTKPSKVVAGADAERTNEMLQAVAYVCLKKMDTSEAVRKVLAAEKPSSRKSSGKEAGDIQSVRPPSVKERPESSGTAKTELKKPVESLSRSKSGSRGGSEGQSSAPLADALMVPQSREPPADSQPPSRPKPEPVRALNQIDVPMIEADDSPAPKSHHRPLSAKGLRRRTSITINPDGDADQPGVQESTTTNPDPPDTGDQLEEDAKPVEGKRVSRPSSARPAPPRARNVESTLGVVDRQTYPKTRAIIHDNDSELEEADTFVILQDPLEVLDTPKIVVSSEKDDGHDGILVQKMTQATKELDSSHLAGSKTSHAGNVEALLGRERDGAAKEVGEAKTAIQTMCRYVYPLSRLLDFTLEDIDSMQKELDMWRKESKALALEIKRETSNKDSITQLQAQILGLDDEIQTMKDKIAAQRRTNALNQEMITQFLSDVIA